MFCDKCGSMLKKEDDDMVCVSCGSSGDSEQDLVSTTEQDDSGLIESVKGANFEGKPTDDSVICDECENGEAYYTIKQTASADEPPTRFFKCTECGNRWREYN